MHKGVYLLPFLFYAFMIRKGYRYWKSKITIVKWSYGVIFFLLLIALLADFLAYSKPLVASYHHQIYFPLFQDYLIQFGLSSRSSELINTDWHSLKYDWVIWSPIPYDAEYQDMTNDTLIPPFTQISAGHYLGTDHLGRDTLAGLIHGCRYSLLIAFASTFMASVIGIFIGMIAGYWGDDRYRSTRGNLIGICIGVLLGLYYGIYLEKYDWQDAFAEGFLSIIYQAFSSLIVMLFCGISGSKLGSLLAKLPYFQGQITVPTDFVISRFIEIPLAIPAFLFMMTILAIVPPGMMWLILILVSLMWMPIATLTRAEMLKLRHTYYAQSAEAMGMKPMRVIFRHLLPNAMPSLSVLIAFTTAGAILAESTLSFLGIGLPAETVTWGGMLSLSRNYPSAWWLAVLPGSGIFMLVTALNYIGEDLSRQKT
jgi:peptide/nickel transport system permease protein